MNLTPADVRNVAFHKPPLGRRGYDEQEVDSFLDRVEETLTNLYHEIERLKGALAAASGWTAYPAAERAPLGGSVDYTAADAYPSNPPPTTQPPVAAPAESSGEAYPTYETDPLRTEIDDLRQRLERLEQALNDRRFL